MSAWPDGMPEVGQRAERTRRVTARGIELFTEITGDRNPLHYDEAAAAASPFGEIIVQGGVTSGILNALVAEDLPGPGTVFLNADWDFGRTSTACNERDARRWPAARRGSRRAGVADFMTREEPRGC